LDDYGVRWVLVPDGSAATRYFNGPPAADIGGVRIYEIPGNRMKSYPGLDKLVPGAANARSLSRLVMQVLGRERERR
jgi:hypothetical protein